MERAIRQRYSDDILEQARQCYGIAPGHIRFLESVESFLYEFEKDGREYILRIGHSLRRTVNQIRGELDWINYLAAGGVSVAHAIPSPQGNLVETVADGQGGHFLVTAFIKAPGAPPGEHDQWRNEALFEDYGRLIGRMHRLSKKYRPPDPAWRRPEWDDPINLDFERWLPPSEAIILQKFRQLMPHLQALPKSQDSYGLIHQDAHAGNFFLDGNGAFTLFDFDDCVYGWYAYDLAMVLFYAITNRNDTVQFGPRFWHPFMQGYRPENYLDPVWLPEIPYFMKLREIDLYALIHRNFDVTCLDPDGWDGMFMNGRRERIVNDIPYIDFELDLL